jgi:hypothetical protein
MSLTTRKPTGKPSWPIMLLAGAEKAGKSYACAVASTSPIVGRSIWIGVGEKDPDEYGAIDGARFEIAEHDGTYRGILAALKGAAELPFENGVPNLIVLDSATRLWEMLSDEAQVLANRRRKNNSDTDSPIGMDLWNRATDRWRDVMNVLNDHQGPSLITARLDVVTVLDDQGKPTKERMTKIKSQKSLPFDVDVVVEMPARGHSFITGARSLRFDVPMDERKSIADFTVHGLWDRLGLTKKDATAPRQLSGADGNASAQEDVKPEGAAAQALRKRQEGSGAAPIDWEAELVKSRNSLDMLRDLHKKASHLNAPAAFIESINAAGKALSERAVAA